MLLLLLCSCLLAVVQASTIPLVFDEDLSRRYPANNPLEVRPDDVLSVACNVTGQIYRYETESEFENCMTQTMSPSRVAFCTDVFVRLNFKHLVQISDSPSASMRYSPGDYYLVSYTDPNTDYPSGAPCTNGAKMALRVTAGSDPQDGGGVVAGGTDGLSSSDGTTQIIIVAVGITFGLLVVCGVATMIIVMAGLIYQGGKRKCKRRFSTDNVIGHISKDKDSKSSKDQSKKGHEGSQETEGTVDSKQKGKKRSDKKTTDKKDKNKDKMPKPDKKTTDKKDKNKDKMPKPDKKTTDKKDKKDKKDKMVPAPKPPGSKEKR